MLDTYIWFKQILLIETDFPDESEVLSMVRNGKEKSKDYIKN